MNASGLAGLGLLLSFATVACTPEAQSSPDVTACDGGTWTLLSPMNERREYPGPIELHDGRILVVSGHHLETGTIRSAELFDPETLRWSKTGSLHNPREGGGGMLLEDGRVLVGDGFGRPDHYPSEVYEPSTGEWTLVGKMNVDRQNYTLTRLDDGSVLATGGIDWGTEETLANAELYDPSSGTWRMTAALDRPRFGHHAVKLPDGRVLVIGGSAYPQAFDEPIACLLYDPQTETWSAAATMLQSHSVTGLVVLEDGRVLVLGRVAGDRPFWDPDLAGTAELYDPATETWSLVTPPPQSRLQQPLLRLDDGRVLALGGTLANDEELTAVDVYDPDADSWTALAPMTVPRRNHGAVLLADGRVLVMGGSNARGTRYLDAAELYTPCE